MGNPSRSRSRIHLLATIIGLMAAVLAVRGALFARNEQRFDCGQTGLSRL